MEKSSSLPNIVEPSSIKTQKKVKKNSFKIEKKYNILFIDHCLGKYKCYCEITGRVVYKDQDVMVFATWDLPLEMDKETREHNQEFITILTSSIIAYQEVPELIDRKKFFQDLARHSK